MVPLPYPTNAHLQYIQAVWDQGDWTEVSTMSDTKEASVYWVQAFRRVLDERADYLMGQIAGLTIFVFAAVPLQFQPLGISLYMPPLSFPPFVWHQQRALDYIARMVLQWRLALDNEFRYNNRLGGLLSLKTQGVEDTSQMFPRSILV